MKKLLIAILFALTFTSSALATTWTYTSPVTGFANGLTAQYQLVNVSGGTYSVVTAWTATGVYEIPRDATHSDYAVQVTLTVATPYIVQWRNSSSATQWGSDPVSEYESALASVAGSVGSVTGNVGGNVTGNVTGSVGSVTGAVASVSGAVGSVTGNVGGNLSGSVGSVTGSVGSVTSAVTISGDLTSTMKSSVQTACTSATPTVTISSGTGSGQLSITSGVIAASGNWVTACYNGTPPAASAIATSVWQDATGSDFTASSSIGKLIYTTGAPLPSIPAGWITSTGIASGALAGKGDWSTYSGGDTAGTTTLLSRLPSAITLNSGLVTVGTNNDKTGYTVSTVSDKTGYTATCSTVSDKTGYSLTSAYNAAESCNSTAPDNADIGTVLSAIQNSTYGLSALGTAIASISCGGGGGGGGSCPSVSQIDTQLSGTHGSGAWGSSGGMTEASIWAFSNRSLTTAPFILPVMQGQVYSAIAAPSNSVTIVQGDTPQIRFNLGQDYSGWTPIFGAKTNQSDTSYAIGQEDATWTNATQGQGYVALSGIDTANTGTLFGEFQLRNGTQRMTAIKFHINIIPVINQ